MIRAKAGIPGLALSILLVSVLLLGPAASCRSRVGSGGSKSGLVPPRSYRLGAFIYPQGDSFSDLKTAYYRARGDLEVVGLHVPVDWESMDERAAVRRSRLSGLRWVAGKARADGKKVVVVVDFSLPLHVDLPAGARDYGKGLRDRRIRDYIVGFVELVAEELRPDYLQVGAAVNGYVSKHPSEAKSLIEVVERSYAAAKEVLPDAKVFPGFNYEWLMGVTDPDPRVMPRPWRLRNPKTSIVRRLRRAMDVFAIESFPEDAFSSPGIPDDYYKPAARLAGDRPLLLLPGGWPAGKRYPAVEGEKDQKRFLAQTARDGKAGWSLLMWATYQDVESPLGGGRLDDMGFITRDGRERLALEYWRDLLSRSYRPPAGL